MTELLAALLAVVFVAAFTEGTLGFGFGLVSIGLLPLFVPDMQTAVPLVAVFSFLVNALMLWTMRRHVSAARVLPLCLSGIVGAPIGVFFLQEVDPRWLKLVLGLFIVLYVGWSLLRHVRRAGTPHLAWTLLAGFSGGVLGGAFNTGGPPIVIYTTLTDWPKEAVKSTMQAYFCATNVCQLALMTWYGMITPERLTLNAWGLPVLVLGLWMGGRIYDRIDQETFRRWVLWGLMALGINLVARHI